MMKQDYTLEDYEALAYEFAIRNPQVIKLLKSTLDETVAKELLSYGIDITVTKSFTIYDDDGVTPLGTEAHETYSLEELYLDYPHLGENLKGIHFGNYTFEEYRNLEPDPLAGEYKGNKNIVYPSTKFSKKEDDIDAFKRINKFIQNDSLDNFYDVYIDSMQRIGSSEYFKFDKNILLAELHHIGRYDLIQKLLTISTFCTIKHGKNITQLHNPR